MPVTISAKPIPVTGKKRKRPKRPELTPREAKQKALRLVNALSPRAEQTIEALTTAGVLTANQLERVASVRPRTLQKYQQMYLVEHLPVLGSELKALGLADDFISLRVYTLGPVGLEIAKLRYQRLIPTGYTGYGVDRIIHDILTNEVAIRLASFAIENDYEVRWYSKYEATVHDAQGRPVLEPDAMLIFHKDDKAFHYLIEFHNEDRRTRAKQKVRRYEQVYRDGRWREEWAVEEFPPILVVFTHKAVGKGYREATTDRRGNPRLDLRCRFLGKPWEEIVANKDINTWFNFSLGKWEKILGNPRYRGGRI